MTKSDKLNECSNNGSYIVENDENEMAKKFAENIRRYIKDDGHTFVYLSGDIVKVVIE